MFCRGVQALDSTPDAKHPCTFIPNRSGSAPMCDSRNIQSRSEAAVSFFFLAPQSLQKQPRASPQPSQVNRLWSAPYRLFVDRSRKGRASPALKAPTRTGPAPARAVRALPTPTQTPEAPAWLPARARWGPQKAGSMVQPLSNPSLKPEL